MKMESKRKAFQRSLMPVLVACLYACSAGCLAAMAKESRALDAPGTTDGVKIKMPPQFQAVNEKFIEIYAETRTRTIKKSQPIIVAVNDVLVLHDGSTKETTQIISDKYSLLKSVDHIILATFVALELDTDQILRPEKLQQLQELETLSKKALASLESSGLKGGVQDRQKRLINMSLNLLASTITEKRISAQALTDFCRNSEKMVMQNVDEAVADQLHATDLQVRQWRKQLGQERWKELNVVIVSSHMPRERHSNMQYFAKVLKQSREGEHLFYCEGLSDDADGLKLVGTHILDRHIAVAFFKDAWRMHRDLLSDGAAKYLRKHPPLK